MTVLKRLEKEIARIKGERLEQALVAAHELRDDLGLDSMNQIELSVFVFEEYGIDLGTLAETRGRPFRTIGELLAEIPELE